MKNIKKAAILFFLCSSCFSQILFDFENNVENWQSKIERQQLHYSGEHASSGSGSLKVSVNGSETAWIAYPHALNFSDCQFLKFNVFLPDRRLSEVSFKCYIKDSEWNWFETGLFRIRGGEKQEISINISHTSHEWKPLNHLKNWDSYVARDISEFGIMLFFQQEYTGSFYVDSFELIKPRFPEKNIYLYNFEASEKAKTFEKYEISFSSSYIPSNPFDNREFSVTASFTSPSRKVSEIPAFYYHNYIRHLESDGENLFPYGTEGWKIRFTPQEKGRHTYKINIYRDGSKTAELEGGDFFAESSGKKGFIRWDKKDPMYMSFQNGTFFYPIGHTLRSNDDIRSPYRYEFTPPENMGTFAYDGYFRKMHENGENYARIWMSAWWAGIEWNPFYAPHYKGLGKYSVENAWRLDYILEAADKHDIYVDLTLINHGQFGRPDAEWRDNPYNVMNGGMLKTADEFFTNQSAMEYFQRRLDYIVSRWAYSKNITFWELWNEVDLTLNYNTQNVKKWHQVMHPYIRSIDPYKHLISTHYCRRDADPVVWAIPEIEMIVGNSYNAEMVKFVLDFYMKRKPFEKPMLINEYGVGKNRRLLENNLHAGIWSSSMTPMTGSALFWWWPFIDHFELYFHYKALSRFWKGEDRRGKNFQLTDAKVESENNDIGIIGIQNNSEGFFWLYAEKLFNDKKPAESTTNKSCRLKLHSFNPGNYSLEAWDTYKGEIVFRKELSLSEQSKETDIPEFLNDIALKVRKK
ncbi:MAG TPA: DUF5060 domain-containing protein [bacterium]|nr:DUF5060 domain-containing protein [bacterium]